MTAARDDREEQVEIGSLSGSLGYLLRMAQLDAFERFHARFGDMGLKPAEVTVLWLVGSNPGLRQGTVASVLRIKPSHMTKMIQRLEKKGYVVRRAVPDDRRAVQLTLTPAGAQLVDRNWSDVLNLHRKFQTGLDEGEFEELLQLLRKLTGVADA